MPNYRYPDFTNSSVACVREPTRDLTEVPADTWAVADRRSRIIRELAERLGRTRADVRAAAHELQCSVALVYVLLKRYLAEPSASSLLPRKPGPSSGMSRLHPELDVLINDAIRTTFLTKQRIRMSDLVREIRRRCHALGVPPPGRKAIEIRVRQHPPSLVVARREGKQRARERFEPIIGLLESPRPMALVQIDHTLVDVIVVDSHSRAPIQRPWLTLAIDVHSRCVAGFHLSLEAPSATSVALCIAHACLPKDGWIASRQIDADWPVYGIMRTLHLDNAKEFKSEALRRGCEQYGIKLDYRPVRTPHYGGHIERLIGTMMGKVHLLPGTTYSDVRAKGEVDPEKTATMTIAEVESWLGHAIAGGYHRELHRGIQTTPLAAWASGVDSAGPAKPVPDPRRFMIDFLPIVRRLVRREGVFLHSISYWSDVLRTWIGSPDPMLVRYDPRDLSRIYLLGPDGTYYDLAYRDVRRPPISLWEHRRALKRLRELGQSHVDEAAIFRTVESMRAIVASATARTKGARRDQERRRRALPEKHVATHSPVEGSANSTVEEIQPDSAPRLLPVEEW